jgi:ribosomal protein L28
MHIKGTEHFILHGKKAKVTHDMPGQAQRGGRGITLTHSQLSTRRRWVVNTMLWPLTPGKDPVPIVQ